MFQFTTTTIINSLKDYNNPSEDRIKVVNTDKVLIKRLGTFDPKTVLSFTKATPEPEKEPTATIAVPATPAKDATTIYRLAIYIGLSGSQNSYYANDFVYKGKPFYIEAVATKGMENTALAKALVTNAKKYITMVYEKELVHLKESGANINIKGIDGFQQFRQVELQKWVPAAGEFASSTGDWEVVVPTSAANVQPGNPGFGTYKYLLHNLRLPTGANLRYEHIIQDETPMLDATYVEYILRTKTNRGIMGGDAVGQEATSVVTHVFWVKNDLAGGFETAVTKLGEPTEIDKVVGTDDGVAKVVFSPRASKADVEAAKLPGA